MSRIQIPKCSVLPEITLSGTSIAGIRTSLSIKELGLGFDAGWCDDNALAWTNVVAITHGHHDHIGTLHMHAAVRRLKKLSRPTYVMPPGCIDVFRKAYDAYKILNGDSLQDVSHYHAHPSTHPFSLPRKGWTLVSFPTSHTIDSCGYMVYYQKTKLKQELSDKTPAEIKKLRSEGHHVSESVHDPILAFTGDTRIKGLLDQKQVLSCPLLIMECTYLDIPKDDPRYVTPEKSAERGHIHEADIVKHADAFQCRALVLTHLSKVYSDQEREGLRQRIQSHFGEDRCRIYVF